MSTYVSLQDQFQRYVLTGEKGILSAVVDGPRLDASGRLDVYAHGYRLRLIEVLDADYPALHTLAGDELFEQLARAYIAAHPSVFPNARWFGIHLPHFLAPQFLARALRAPSGLSGRLKPIDAGSCSELSVLTN